MSKLRWTTLIGMVFAATWMIHAAGEKFDAKNLVSGEAASALGYSSIKPGLFRKFTASDLPQPTKAATNGFETIARPEGAWPQAPAGFKVELYATGLDTPRQLRVAPNGDIFLAETTLGQIKVFRGRDKDGKPEQVSVFAADMRRPFGIAFYPPGADPKWVYIGQNASVIRFPYQRGDLKASAAPEVMVADLPVPGGHWSRDIVFSHDGKQMFLAVGSASNVDDPDTHPGEFHRANVLEYTPDGKFVSVYSSGLRNPFGLAVQPQTGEVWTSNMEREGLGDNVPSDFVTHLHKGGFYGWPWYYIGGHQDPRHEGKHPELKDKTLVPDVLLPGHTAAMGLGFYEGTQFPAEYRGDLFVAVHGSWNRAVRSGFEVVRIPLQGGRASGVFEDFLTGFVTADGQVWGRPVGVTMGKDGALYVTDDASAYGRGWHRDGAIWRVSYTGK